MGKIYCSYHPTVAAQWECPECNLQFCGQCVMKSETVVYGMKKEHHLCPKCRQYAQSLAVANVIEPFWARLPKIFAYPFRYQPLAFIFLVGFIDAFVSLLGPVLMLRGLVFLFWGGLIKFSFAALRETAYGNFKPPEITPETITEGWGLVIKQILIIVLLIGGGIYILGSLGPGALFVYAVLAFLLYPAMTIVLVVTESLMDALNPMMFARMAWRIGRGYLIMYFFYVLLAMAPYALSQYVLPYLPFFFQKFFITVAQGYYMVVTYHLMGYVLLQYHDKVGWEVELQEYLNSEKAVSKQKKPTGDPMLDQLDAMVRDGQIDEAIDYLQSETQGHIADVDVAARYYKLLRAKQLVPDMVSHGAVYLDMLVEAKREQDVCEVYTECAAANPNFMPKADTLLKTASILNRNGKYKESVNAYNRFIKANPKDQRVPKAYFQAANILNERLNAPKKAHQVISAIIKRFPDHEIIPHAKDYLGRIAAG